MDNAKLICLVAILKDEEKFIDEWLVYHKMIGINHFFLYDDDPKQPLKDFLLPHSDYITVINWQQHETPEVKPSDQTGAYTHALNNFIREFEWVIFLDGDEFIVLRQHLNLKEFLSDFKDNTAVSLNWHLFGHNGFYDDPNRLITSSLTRRMLSPFPATKNITKTTAIAGIPSPHHCLLKYGEFVDCNHRVYKEEIYEGKTKVAHINHYHCRSFKHWMNRVSRGTALQNAGPHKWRFNEDQCLKRFVTMIARDKNEYVDEYMLKYKYDIYENINKLNRNKSFVIKNSISIQKPLIQQRLKLIADFLISEGGNLKNIGLFNGRAGIAIFLFHYSKFADESGYAKIALELLENITDEITEDSPIDINNGLTGYGIALEHLVQESFIKVDTDELLEDIDMVLRYFISKPPLSNGIFFANVIEQGEYYFSRYNNPINTPFYNKDGGNDHYLESIIDMINPASENVKKLSYLDLICKTYLHRDNRVKAIEDIQREIIDIKNRVDNTYPLFGEFDPIYMAEILSKFSRNDEDEFYLTVAYDILHKYENGYWEYLNTIKVCDNSRIKIALRYLNLGTLLHKTTFTEKGLSYLNPIINTNDQIMPRNTSDISEVIISGFAFLMINEWNNQLYNLISINVTSHLKSNSLPI